MLYDQFNKFKEYNIKDSKNDAVKINFDNHIKLKNVSFKYPNTEQLIFENVNIKFEKGKHTELLGNLVLVSQLLDLLTKFIDPTTDYVDNVELYLKKV